MSLSSSTTRPITLDHLVALSDEIVALARAGVPLEQGLASLGRDLPGELGRVTTRVGRRLEAGESLSEIFRSEGDGIPSFYRAVVEAGLRTGQLPLALEGAATTARRVAELRSIVASALIYPVIVVLTAYGVCVASLAFLLPGILTGFQQLRVPIPRAIEVLAGGASSVAYWWPLFPAALLLLAVAWWIGTGRASTLQSGRAGRFTRLLPAARRLREYSQQAVFAEVLSLLLDHRVPLDEALRLAADTTGDAGLRREVAEIAVGLREGKSLGALLAGRETMPPMLYWLLASNRPHEALLAGLRHLAEESRRRATRQAETLRWLLPMLLTIVLGASATLIAALVVFLPWATLMRGLAP